MNLFYKIRRSLVWKRKIPLLWTILSLIIISITVIAIVQNISARISRETAYVKFPKIERRVKPPEVPGRKFIPGPISLETMKTKGCVADGMLSGYGGNTNSMAKLINRSECVYLHRALETWANPPDFEKAQEIMDKIDKRPIIFGMFIAEALRKNEDYFYLDKGREFNFSKMCKSGTDNRWGEHTCIPDLKDSEYQRYLIYITHRAMNMGIQSFLFGQIYLQDGNDLEKSPMPDIIADMKSYARSIGLQIVVGAQTNSITDENYLRLFDYIEGGVGIDSAGNIEDGHCWSQKSSCWALLWNENYSSRANNVFLHLDWSGLSYDDMSTFARMNHTTRIQTLENLHNFFIPRKMGFMMPFLATINKTIGGCYGPMKRFYSPDNKYTCKDEDQINAILKGN